MTTIKTFTLYEEATGRVMRSGADPYPELCATPGVGLLLGVAVPLNSAYIEDGKPVPIPPAPGAFHVFDYAAKQWAFDSNAAWRDVRSKRDWMLQASRLDTAPDVPIQTKTEWATYRQALRDVTSQSDPLNIVWPVPPSN